MDHFVEFWPHASQWIAGVGIPAVLAWFGRQQWKSASARRAARAADGVEEATAPDKIKTSSVTALESQMMAMDRTFGLERASYERRIGFLEHELTDRDVQIEQKDRRLREALEKIDELQRQLTELAEQVRAEVAKDLEHP